ncbi:hypothetical protein HMI56_005386 [Coelomomyces lativittatus]|nr:hypothetical protein HMI56_005386 [Coelomomyces lativittatus]
MLKLVYIQGNISNSINALKPLDVHQIHLHSLSLEKWLAELPLNLQFSFKTQEATSPFALHLNLLYYFTVLMLYRPCLRPSSEYPANFSTNATSICITTIKAIIVILEVAHSHSILNALSIFSIHSLLMCGTTLYIIFTNTSVNVPFSSLYEFASKLLNFMKEVLPLWPVLGYLADLHTKMLHSLLSGAFLTKHESSLDNQPTLSKSFTALRHSKVVLPPTTLSKEKSFSLKPRTAFMCPQSSLYPSTTPAKVSTLHPSSSTSSSYFSNSLSSNISTTSVTRIPCLFFSTSQCTPTPPSSIHFVLFSAFQMYAVSSSSHAFFV